MGMTRAELLELLKKARKQLKKYHVPNDEQTVTLSINTIENALLEQQEIVRCKDCKWRGTYDCPVYHGGDGMCSEPDDWFCANGERSSSPT